MNTQWFVLHTLAGQEQKVRDTINRRIKSDEMEEYIREVLLPMEKVVEVRVAKKPSPIVNFIRVTSTSTWHCSTKASARWKSLGTSLRISKV